MNTSSACSTLLAAWLALAAAAGAAEPGDDARRSLDDAVLGLLESSGSAAAIEIEQPQRVRRELGAVIDAQPADGGLPRVMAVTPGGAAERIGLRAGDRLLGANGKDLGADAGERLRALLQGERRVVGFEVQRGSEVLRLSGPLDETVLPAYRLSTAPVRPAPVDGCGRLDTAAKPPPSESLYPALLHEIDGGLAGPLDAAIHRVGAGRHVLKISEQIRSTEFNQAQNRKRSQLFPYERYKYLELEVQPDTTYFIGVRFHPEHRDAIRTGDYWEPVVWSQKHDACR